jgi:hypothetical protein
MIDYYSFLASKFSNCKTNYFAERGYHTGTLGAQDVQKH